MRELEKRGREEMVTIRFEFGVLDIIDDVIPGEIRSHTIEGR